MSEASTEAGSSASSTVSIAERSLAPADLLALSIEPNWTMDDPEERTFLAVQLDAQPELRQPETARLSAWLTQQPVPVIGVGAASSRLGNAVDLFADGPQDLQRLAANIRRWPQASAMLVQVLRATAQLGAVDGLAVESMAYATLQGGAEFTRWLAERKSSASSAGRSEDILLLDRQAERLDLVLNCPENRNALSRAMRDALTDAFRWVVQDLSITRVEVSARGPCFSAGGDLSEFGTMTDLAQAHRIRMTHMPARYLAACRDRCQFRVHGACIGAGIELPAFAARLTAKPDARFRLPEVGMGLIPGAGGCVSIPRRIGRQRTARMAILGDDVAADEALAWGLIDAIEA